MNELILQLKRLRRHYDGALKTCDHVSLLDLANSLRIWVELKAEIPKLSPKFTDSIAFKSSTPNSAVWKFARNRPHVFAYMPGGVITYASSGRVTHLPSSFAPDNLFVAHCIFAAPDNFALEFHAYSAIGGTVDKSLVTLFDRWHTTSLRYIPWLGAEAARVAYSDKQGTLQIASIPREQFVKRIANTMGGSHPLTTGKANSSNQFDEPVALLMSHLFGDMPLPYLIILKIARDILAVAEKTIT